MMYAVVTGAEVIREPGNRYYVPRYVYPNDTYQEYAAGSGFLLTGKNSSKDFIDAIENKSPFMRSENYRRLPDEAIMFGDIRIQANVSLKDPGGFGIGAIALWKDPSTNESIPLMAEAYGNKEEIWDQFKNVELLNSMVRKWSLLDMSLLKNITEAKLNKCLSCVKVACRLLSVLSQEEGMKFGKLKGLCTT